MLMLNGQGLVGSPLDVVVHTALQPKITILITQFIDIKKSVTTK